MLTDVIEPKLNGRKLTDKSTVMYPGLKVLFVSDYTDNIIVHHGICDSGTHFITKPPITQDLLRKVWLVLGDLSLSTTYHGPHLR